MEEHHRWVLGIARFPVKDLQAVNVCVFVIHAVFPFA